MDAQRAVNWLRGQFSLDTPTQDLLSPETAADVAVGSVPVLSTAAALRDMARAYKADDPTAGALAAASLVPFGKAVGPAKQIISDATARFAPHQLLAKVLKEFEDSGSREAWRPSNWLRGEHAYVGPDKVPKWQISDEQARLLIPDKPGMYKGGADQIIHHPELFRNHPELRSLETTVNLDPSILRNKGSFNSYQGTITADTNSYQDALGKMLHELTHGVQSMSPDAAKGMNVKAVTDALAGHLKEPIQKDLTAYPQEVINRGWQTYRNAMGEAEARIPQGQLAAILRGEPARDVYERYPARYQGALPDEMWKSLADPKWAPR